MLPEDKHLIIDSKVSLTAYERYYQANDDVARQVAAREREGQPGVPPRV
jgi:DNA recombination protein RmuC